MAARMYSVYDKASSTLGFLVLITVKNIIENTTISICAGVCSFEPMLSKSLVIVGVMYSCYAGSLRFFFGQYFGKHSCLYWFEIRHRWQSSYLLTVKLSDNAWNKQFQLAALQIKVMSSIHTNSPEVSIHYNSSQSLKLIEKLSKHLPRDCVYQLLQCWIVEQS